MRTSTWVAPLSIALALGTLGQSLPPPGMLPPMPSLPVPAELMGDASRVQVGQWVEYDYRAGRMRAPIILHIAIVGREDDGLWVETTYEQDGGNRIISKILTAGGFGESARARRVILQGPGLPPVELDANAAGPEATGAPRGPQPAAGRLAVVGDESLRVVAGTFAARHLRGPVRGGEAEMWTSARVPLGGVLRFRGPALFMELRAFGFGATSRVRGTPGRLDLPAVPNAPDAGAGAATPASP